MHVRGRVRRAGWAVVAGGLLLGATACDSESPSSEALARSTTTQPPPIRYVALGDSFSSGEGAPPDDRPNDPCHQAAAAWPRRLDAESRRITSLDHRACSGAKTANLLTAWSGRNLPAQIPATPDPAITLVTLTVGGNDAGFGDIVASCVIWVCPAPTDPAFTDALAALTTTLEDDVYPALQRAYPNARIAHVGYPRLTPAPGKRSSCAWLTRDDQKAAAGIVDAINTAIQTAAASGAVTYVDVRNVMAGHELCTSSPWIKSIPSAGQAHPTAKGQHAIKAAVAKALAIPLR